MILGLFDVAVTINDWCIDLATGVLGYGACTSNVAGLYIIRFDHSPLTSSWFAAMLRAAVFRFWLSRVFDFL